MKHANKTVTVYHAEYDPVKGYDVYTGRVYENVSIYGGIDTAVSKDGLSYAVHATMRIQGKKKCPVCNGDLVLIGAHETTVERPDDLSDMVDYVYTVVGVADNTEGYGAHIKVVMQ